MFFSSLVALWQPLSGAGIDKQVYRAHRALGVVSVGFAEYRDNFVSGLNFCSSRGPVTSGIPWRRLVWVAWFAGSAHRSSTGLTFKVLM